MLIEMHTLEEMVDTMVLPAAFSYLGVAHEVGGEREGGGGQVDSAARCGERDRRS